MENKYSNLIRIGIGLASVTLMTGCNSFNLRGLDLEAYCESDYGYVKVGLVFGALKLPDEREYEFDFGKDGGGCGNSGGCSGGSCRPR